MDWIKFLSRLRNIPFKERKWGCRKYEHYLKYGTFHLTKEEIEKGIENPNKYIHDYFKEVFARGIKSVEDFKLFEEE